MKLKKLFALALAVCMMVSVMPTSFAGNGFLSLDGVQPTTTTSGPSLTLDNPGTVSGGSVVTPSVSQSSQSVYTPYVYSNPYGVSSVADEGDGEGETTPAVDMGLLDAGETVGTAEDIVTTLVNTPAVNTPPQGWPVTHPAVGEVKDPLFTSKRVDWDDGEQAYKVRLESYVTGSYETKTITKVETDPLDVILILDRSSRMSETKMAQLQTAANSFLTQLQQNSADSRVAIVSYAGEGASSFDTLSDADKKNEEYYKALVNITAPDSNTVNGVLTGAITGLGTAGSGDAYSDEAFEKAVRIFQSLTTYEASPQVEDCDNERMVIFFTAGIPGAGSWTLNTTAYNIAQRSIHWSAVLKATEGFDAPISAQKFYYGEEFDSSDYDTITGCGATVYCVGIDLDACTHSLHSLTDIGAIWGATPACDGSKTNEYLYRVSSHRPTGTHAKDEAGIYDYTYPDIRTKGNVEGSVITGTKYYLAGGINDVAGMLSQTISTTITQNGGPDVDLTAAAELKDVISPYFKLVDGVTIKTADYTLAGSFTNETTVTASSPKATIAGKTITVTGFNYGENWVGTNMDEGTAKPHGQKLIVEFYIVPEMGFLGGTGVPTNGYASGVYANSNATTPLEHFSYPIKDIAIPDFTVTAANKNIYLSDSLNSDELVNGAYVAFTKNNELGQPVVVAKWDPNGENTVLESWQYAYLKGFVLTSTVPADQTDDAEFTVTCTVTPNAGDAKTASAEANLTVFKPHITFKDSTIYLGEEADYTDNRVNPCVEWLDNDGNTAKNMTGFRPKLEVTYSEEKDLYFSDCEFISIDVVELNGEPDIELMDESGVVTVDFVNLTTFWNQHEDGKAYGTDETQFTVHVLTPIVNIEDQVIYLSQSVEQEEVTAAWENECEHHKTKGGAPSLKAAFQLQGDTSNVYTDSVSPEECKTFVAYPVIDGVVSRAVSCPFKVHVLVPTVKVDDFAMHLSTSVNLEERASTTWACTETGEDNCGPEDATNGRTVPEGYGYNFYDGTTTVETVYSPDSDKNITVIPKVGVKEYTDYSKTFAIDVLMPIVTVPKKEVWADMNASVDMDEWYGITASNVGWDETVKTTVTEAPKDITFDYDFTVTKGVTDGNGHWADKMEHEEYIQGSADSLMTVTKATWTYAEGKSYEAVDDHLIINSEYDFKININKFKAIITNNGTQNAIYTLSNGTKVAVPAKGSVTVAGLICGKEYAISETADNDWTWRYATEATKNTAAYTVGSVDNKPETDSSVNVDMNYGEKTNTKWLADEDCVVNKATTQATTINPTLSVKKKDEEVTNA